jgi:NADH:ubiquinone oxidoreductase subunit 3 (subunit A)
MLDQWLFVGLYILIALFFPTAAILTATIFSPKKPNKLKTETYECGMQTVGNTWVQFKVQYYIYALLFLVFDVEMIFLYPWAVAFAEISWLAVIAGILFIILLMEGLFFAWRKGALEWS